MKDLDFDELDKAVNSLMGSVKSSDVSQPNSTEPEETVVTLPELPQDESPAKLSDENPQIPQETPDASPSPRTTLATRRTGRFMDVMHPSSDMRTSQTPQSTSRQGVQLSPINDIASVTEKVKPQEPHLVVTKEEPEKLLEATASTSEWPDPLDMPHNSSFTDSKEDEPSATDTLEPAATQASKTTPHDDYPSQSPFLTDAKVEKRPLGSASATTPATIESSDISLEPASSIPSETNDSTAKQSSGQPIPAELSDSSLLAIESDAPEEEKVVPMHVSPTPIVNTVSHAPEPTPVQSIAQQYKPQPSSGDQHHDGMYDSAAQPLTHPPKKKSGWLVVVIITIMILLGGGGAAALYYLNII